MNDDSREHDRDERPGTPRETLPPPAFAPGSAYRSRAAGGEDDPAEAGVGVIPDDAYIDLDEPARPDDGGHVPDDAFIHPDDLDAQEGSEPSISEDAFIDPDEPIVRTGPPATPDDYEAVLQGQPGSEELDDDEVLVTGIGDDPHLEDPAGERYGDTDLARVVQSLSGLAEELRREGEAALGTDAHMSRLEVGLRTYCSGYLAGVREGRKD